MYFLGLVKAMVGKSNNPGGRVMGLWRDIGGQMLLNYHMELVSEELDNY